MTARVTSLCSLLLVALTACPTLAASEMERARYLMGTLCTAQIHAPNDTVASRALKIGFDEIARIERVLSSWDESSDLAKLNAAGALEPFPCPTELYAALVSARALAEVTDGAYDPTIGPLVQAWNMHGKGRVPGEREIEKTLERVGWRGLILDSSTQMAAFAREGMAIDLGGIGKGFALDHAVAAMEQYGAVRGLLNFGGEICAWSDDEPWDVSIADPADRMRPVLHFTIANGAISTSGQSERGFEHKGVRYGHVLDAKSGRPVESTGSVTVIATSATQADALSTALFVMGRDDAGMFARAHHDIGVIWLDHSSAGLLAWIWNAPHVRAEGDLTVHYMDEPGE